MDELDLEKQIPIKPIVAWDELGNIEIKCPWCKKSEEIKPLIYKCPWCDQLLKWR